MNKFPILVIGRNPEILAIVVRLINNNSEWSACGAQTDEAAIRLFAEQAFSMILFGGGIEPESETLLRIHFQTRNASIPIVQHYGGGSGLLSNEIMEVIARSGS